MLAQFLFALLFVLLLASPASGQRAPKPADMVGHSCGMAWLYPLSGYQPYIGWRTAVVLSPAARAWAATIMVGDPIPPTWMGLSAPPGCEAHLAIMDTYPLGVEELVVFWELEIPYEPGLVGMRFMLQSAVADWFTPFGWYVTNGVECVISMSP